MTYARTHAHPVAHTRRYTCPDRCTHCNAGRHRDPWPHRRGPRYAQEAPHWSTPGHAHTCTPRTGIRAAYPQMRDIDPFPHTQTGTSWWSPRELVGLQRAGMGKGVSQGPLLLRMGKD